MTKPLDTNFSDSSKSTNYSLTSRPFWASLPSLPILALVGISGVILGAAIQSQATRSSLPVHKAESSVEVSPKAPTPQIVVPTSLKSGSTVPVVLSKAERATLDSLVALARITGEKSTPDIKHSADYSDLRSLLKAKNIPLDYDPSNRRAAFTDGSGIEVTFDPYNSKGTLEIRGLTNLQCETLMAESSARSDREVEVFYQRGSSYQFARECGDLIKEGRHRVVSLAVKPLIKNADADISWAYLNSLLNSASKRKELAILPAAYDDSVFLKGPVPVLVSPDGKTLTVGGLSEKRCKELVYQAGDSWTPAVKTGKCKTNVLNQMEFSVRPQ